MPQMAQLPVGKAILLGGQDQIGISRFQIRTTSQTVLHLHDLVDVVEEPGVDLGALINVLDAQSQFERVPNKPDALVVGSSQPAKDFIDSRLIVGAPAVERVASQSESAGLE